MRHRHPIGFHVLAFGVAAAFGVASPAVAQERAGPDVEAAVERGLKFMAAQQLPDGRFIQGPNELAVTGLSVLGFLAAGHTPGVGVHGEVVRKAVDKLTAAAEASAYVGGLDGSRMYGQGIVTLALAEACGAEPDPARRRRILATIGPMVNLILTAQAVAKGTNFDGGWRYEPASGDSDLSLSGWCAMALRAAQNNGVLVPKGRVDHAVSFVLKTLSETTGGFAYQPGGPPTISMTSVAMLDLSLLDSQNRPAFGKAAAWLAANPVRDDTPLIYYAIYYSTQAATQAGGELFTKVWANNQKLLLERQQPNGSFAESVTAEEKVPGYSTAMAVLTLAVPFQTLPTYQR